MKKILAVLIAILILTSCSDTDIINIPPQKVNTIAIEESQIQNYEEYSGYLLANDLKKYSFTQGGQILKVNVKKGDTVKDGDVLAIIDSKLADLARSNAKTNKDIAENQSKQVDINMEGLENSLEAEKIALKQAEEAFNIETLKLETLRNTFEKNISQLEDQFDLLTSNYEKNKTLYENGIISESEFNNIKIQYDNSKDELDGLYKDYETNENLQIIAISNAENNIFAQEIKVKSVEDQINATIISKSSANLQIEQAGISVEQYNSQLEDMTLKATMDGSVIEIVVGEGEVTGAGTPVVIVRSNSTVVKVGVPSESYKNISYGEEAVVTFNDTDFKGTVISIATYPDEATKNYEIEIEVMENDIPLGSLVNVKFSIDESQGVFIPINAIINRNGVNYVYIVNEDNLVEKREVILGKVAMDKVEVEGLEPGTLLIIDELSQLRENDQVIVE